MSTNLSNHIKTIRNQKGFSQELLAEKSGLSLRTIQRVENSETEPRGDTLLRITKALEVTPDQLLEWNQIEDKSTLTVLNLSALCFLFNPIVGVILPLLIWVSRKQHIKKVDLFGRRIINFQITFTAIIYSMKGFLFLLQVTDSVISHYLEYLFDTYGIPTFYFQFIYFGIPYIYNVVYILINTLRIRVEEEVSFNPAFKVL